MPCRKAQFTPYTGPFMFELQRHDLSPDEFCSQLDQFFLQLPRDFRYAVYVVEVRNPGFLGMRYLQVLSYHGVAHVYNHWSGMPSLAEQHRRISSLTLSEEDAQVHPNAFLKNCSTTKARHLSASSLLTSDLRGFHRSFTAFPLCQPQFLPRICLKLDLTLLHQSDWPY